MASLDSTAVQQTKTEIRKIAAEIAELANSEIDPRAFLDGFLPRLVTAMGASAAAVWQVRSSGLGESERARSQNAASFSLIANHGLPAELIGASESAAIQQPTPEHSNILGCVVAEGQPILVPPSTVTIDADRPANPLNDALVVVPVQLDSNVDYLIEVVQSASGGPAAQRGYLRFVAQMADLMSDFLRRWKLREMEYQFERVQLQERWLVQCAQQSDWRSKANSTANALAEVLNAQQAVLYTQNGKRSFQVQAISGVDAPDPRSESIEQLVRFLATRKERAQLGPERPYLLEDVASSSDEDPELSAVCRSFQAKSAARLLLENSEQETQGLACLLFFAENVSSKDVDAAEPVQLLPGNRAGHQIAQKQVDFAQALGAILTTRHSGLVGSLKRMPATKFWQGSRLWRYGLALAGLVAMVIPVPQQIIATGVLRPEKRYCYYAPMDAVVSRVHVDDGDWVQDQQPLLTLLSRDLNNELDRLNGEIRLVNDRISDRTSVLQRSQDLSSQETDRIEAELAQLYTTLRKHKAQLVILNAQREDLKISALGQGQIATWDARNRLVNRPVKFGSLLLTSFEPDGAWYLEISVPDYRVGLVADAMENDGEASVRFSLAGEEDVWTAKLTNLASQAQEREARSQDLAQERFVIGRANFDSTELKLRKDGAVARVTIDCGQVPAIWLVVRDAYWATSSWIKLLW